MQSDCSDYNNTFYEGNLLEQFHTHSQKIHWHSYNRVTILWLIYIYDGAILWKSTVQIRFPMCNQVMFHFLEYSSSEIGINSIVT